MSSIKERREKAQEQLDEYRKINGLFDNHLVKKDLEKLSKENTGYTVDASGAVTLKDIGYLVPGGLRTEQKQSAAEAYFELSKLKALEGKIAGRDRTKLKELAGESLTLQNIDEALNKYQKAEELAETKANYARQDAVRGQQHSNSLEIGGQQHSNSLEILGTKQVEAANVRAHEALEAEKIRAAESSRRSKDRLFETQMQNADRALEREMRLFEIDEKSGSRKAELWQALFGLGAAFMI